MRCFVQLWSVLVLGILVASCGSGDDPPSECVEQVCPCTDGGIRAAIEEGLGTYTFDCAGPTTVTTRSEIVIDEDVTLDGDGLLTVDGNRTHRVFSVSEGVTAELIGLTVTNGRQADEHGGAIRNEGTLTLTSTTVSNSTAGRESGCRTDDADLLCSEGGGIWNTGTLTLIDTTVSGSMAHFGGALANRGGNMVLIDSAVRSSSATGCRGVGAVVCSGGGGVWNSGTLMMMNSSAADNAADWGGGLYNRAAATIEQSTISRNSALFDGGGLLNFEALTLIGTTAADNAAGQSGGGIANEAGVLEVARSTVSGNEAVAAGGGLYNPAGADAAVVNATISNNTANSGGGIYSGGGLTLTSSTMADNAAPSASAIFDPGSSNASPRLIGSSLISGDCAGSPFISGGYNVESPGATCGFDQETDRPGEPMTGLGPLEDNGGPTPTHALEPGSVGVDRIPSEDCVDAEGAPLSTDQRGDPRPAGASAACDVGAFELQS